jgi:hypothetical protein
MVTIMDERVAKLKTPEECEQFAKNAIERKRPDLAQAARKKAIELRAKAYGASTKVECECLEAVCAYEEILTTKNKRKTMATRTRQMIKKRGIIPAVEHVVTRDKETVGYAALQEMDLQDYTFEAVVVKYPASFSAEAVQSSKERLAGC